MEKKKSRLVNYLGQVMEERRLSQRALAMYVGVSSSTISRIMSGEDPDPETLRKLAEYLNVPAEYLFRLAGYLPQREELKTQAIEMAEHLLRQMDEEGQKMALEIIESLHERYAKSQEE